MTTLFVIIMGIGDMLTGQLSFTFFLQLLAVALIGDMVTAAGGVALYLEFGL